MSAKTENLVPAQFLEVGEAREVSQDGNAAAKKVFVEPEVTFPVDVLESTTFFQFTESGVIPP